MLNYIKISKNEIAKYQKIFTKMNQISNPRHKNFISKQADKYLLLAKKFKMSSEKIRKLLIKTSWIKWIKYQENRIKIKQYNSQILLNRLNVQKIKKKEEKKLAQEIKYLKISQTIRTIVQNTNKTISAKTISAILKEELGYTFSGKHIYHLVKNGKLQNLNSHIFPFLRRGKYQKMTKNPQKGRFFCSIDKRPAEISQRLRLGDLEVDTIEGQKDDKFNIATAIDRRSQRVATSIYEAKISKNLLPQLPIIFAI